MAKVVERANITEDLFQERHEDGSIWWWSRRSLAVLPMLMEQEVLKASPWLREIRADNLRRQGITEEDVAARRIAAARERLKTSYPPIGPNEPTEHSLPGDKNG